MYIRIAKKNPINDFSVTGWSDNSIQIENICRIHNIEIYPENAEEILSAIESENLIVEFSSQELADALENNTLDNLPLIHTGAVCCFQSANLEEWAQEHTEDLIRMGYLNLDGFLVEETDRIWLVEGTEKDINDFEGVYVIPSKSEDITGKALKIIQILRRRNTLKGGKNMKNMGKMIIEKTKKGHPAYWEGGGGKRNTGDATIISGKDGQPKKAIYIRSRGSLANANHALFILEVGDYIVEANHHREDFEIQIFRITGFEDKEEGTYALTEQVNYFSMGEWDAELPSYLEAAVHAAMHKATCYHCREPHYIRD